MGQSTALETLHELAEKEVENAALRLGEMRKGFQQAEEQLNMLINYQFEYSTNLNTSMSQGIASTRWQNYQQFIQTLEKAIDQHRQQLSAWTSKVDQALNFWQEKQKRLQAWQTLRERKATERLLAENRLDQKQMDEYAQRATMRKGE
ncbi:flagellar export protein FliJ [Dryocola sp. BD613]|uniref:flagellar export protein FliJ n=1 Tax=Dryocola sp. BD613 TaxID=3133272 RepID=UPI003F4FDE97